MRFHAALRHIKARLKFHSKSDNDPNPEIAPSSVLQARGFVQMEPHRKRINKLTLTQQAEAKRELNFDDLIALFSIDRQLKNCAPRTIQFYGDNLRYLQKVYEDNGMLLDVPSMTPNQLKIHVLGPMLEKGLSSYTINGR